MKLKSEDGFACFYYSVDGKEWIATDKIELELQKIEKNIL